MHKNGKNALIALLLVSLIGVTALLAAVVKKANYRIEALQTFAAPNERGANNAGRSISRVPAATATGDPAAIVAAALQQGKLDSEDQAEIDPGSFDTLQNTDVLFAGGAQ